MDVWYHPSSWSSRVQREHAEVLGRGAWQTADGDLAALIAAASAAAQTMFPYLDRQDILRPPHSWFDAALARQVVVFVLVERFQVPRRVVAAVSLMSREAVLRGVRTIQERRESEAFSQLLDLVLDRAGELLREGRVHG